jgi:indolepyruvate ferredoxin oxidoreductase beta subunit
LAAVERKLYIKQAEVHGMSQRGGDVQSNLRISDQEIASDLIPLGAADIILSIEPMEALRYLPFLKKDGWIVTNTTPFVNIDEYPALEEVMGELQKIKNHIAIDADTAAKEAGSPKSSNMVMLGAASPFLDIPFECLETAVHTLFGKKEAKIVEANIKALHVGKALAEKNSNTL